MNMIVLTISVVFWSILYFICRFVGKLVLRKKENAFRCYKSVLNGVFWLTIFPFAVFLNEASDCTSLQMFFNEYMNERIGFFAKATSFTRSLWYVGVVVLAYILSLLRRIVLALEKNVELLSSAKEATASNGSETSHDVNKYKEERQMIEEALS